MKKKPLVACLARTSTDMQHTSIDNQHEIFYRWIEKNDSELFDIYTDEGISGTKGIKRIEWLRMIEDAKDRKFDVLLAKSFSRFGRNQRETLDAIATLRTNGIRIVFIENNLDSEQDATKFDLIKLLKYYLMKVLKLKEVEFGQDKL
ncbi:MAG: recombinase family protein [Ruminiclostridium sp.]